MPAPITHEFTFTTGFNTSPVSLTLTTTQTNYVAVLQVYNENTGSLARTTTITSTTGHTWTLRKRSNASATGCLEWWWTSGTTAGSINATITFSGAYDDYAALMAVVTGCGSLTTPFDANAGLPAAHSSTTTSWTPSFTGVNTSNANDLLLFLTGQAAASGTPASGFTTVTNVSTGGGSWAAGTQMDAKSVSAVQSGATFTLGSAVGAFGSAGEAIFDALSSVAAVGGGAQARVMVMA